MIAKPAHVFDRVREWQGLVEFASYDRAGATLGVVSGRRRQGKSFLLQALAREMGGLYFGAIEATEAESLRYFTSAVARYGREPLDTPVTDWDTAIPLMFRQFRGRPLPVIIDEFPYLSKVSPALPSIIQRELGPGGSGRESAARLLLCGSAMSVMGGLLAGHAPLRGRAGLELVVQPFGFRDAADFWEITDPRLAALVHSILGGTPAYRYEFTQGDKPADVADFGPWVIRAVLNPQRPLFREARYLLAEESEIRDPAIYHSVLAAIATGNTTNGGIANFIGRKSSDITHSLNVLEDCGLIAREPDLFRHGRVTYRIVEPLITFYEGLMRRRWSELENYEAETVWDSMRPTFQAQIAGPHFEALCRDFARIAGKDVYGGLPAEVGRGVIRDPVGRNQIEADVVVLAPQESDQPRRILSLGEAKWGEVMGVGHFQRLARARDLLARKGYDTADTRLTCYSGTGFNDELRETSARDPRTQLIDLDRLYAR
jgi:hypothetical protein